MFTGIQVKNRCSPYGDHRVSTSWIMKKLYAHISAAFAVVTDPFDTNIIKSVYYKYFIIVGTRMFISTGFATWSFIPTERTFCIFSAKTLAVIAIIGILDFLASFIFRMRLMNITVFGLVPLFCIYQRKSCVQYYKRCALHLKITWWSILNLRMVTLRWIVMFVILQIL